MKNSKLTIAIPTFNNHQMLLKQLISIRDQINNQDEDLIKVLIIDNNSNPSVNDFLNKNSFEGKKFNFTANKTNIGADGNILKCFEKCETEWLWVLSDNDLIKENAIATVMKIIESHKECAFINFLNEKERLTTGFYDFCKNTNYGNTFFISICCYNMKFLNDYLFYYYENLNTNQGQLVFLLKLLSKGNDVKCYLSSYNPTQNCLPPKWSKFKFIDRSLNLYNAFSISERKVIDLTYKPQIIILQLFYLSISRTYENLGFRKWFRLFLKINMTINIRTLTKKDFYKMTIYNFLSLVVPKLFHHFRDKRNHVMY